MLTNKKLKRFVSVVTVASLALSYAVSINVAVAASLTDVSDTLSDSAPGATGVEHKFAFTTVSAGLAIGDYYQVLVPDDFTNVLAGNVICADSASTSPATVNLVGDYYEVKCEATEAIATGTKLLVITGVTNPVAGTYTFTVSTKTSLHADIETSDLVVSIIDDVVVSASVPATLSFAIGGVDSGTTVNGDVTTGTSTATTMDYGTLAPGASSTMAQELVVGTNAAGGFTVTVQQNHNLKTANDADIDAFINGAPDNDDHLWQSPAGTLDNELTYGHFGLTSEDDSLLAGDEFAASSYKGFSGANPVEVMYHGGPSNGQDPHIGKTKVAYTVEINALQEAGDYTNTLTYICTPTY